MSKLSTISMLSDAELDAISGGHGRGRGHRKDVDNSVNQTTGDITVDVRGANKGGVIVVGNANAGDDLSIG